MPLYSRQINPGLDEGLERLSFAVKRSVVGGRLAKVVRFVDISLGLDEGTV